MDRRVEKIGAKYFTYLFPALAVAVSILYVPFHAFAASPCSQGGLRSESFDSTTKEWACTYSAFNNGSVGAGSLTEFYNEDGTPVMVNGQHKVIRQSGETGRQVDQTGKSIGTCSIWDGSWTFEKCFWFPLTKGLGQSFLAFGGFLLWMSGVLFDVLIKHVILDFAGTLQTNNLNQWIELSWTVLRDLANLGIIFFLVLISVSIILGWQEFGQKRLIANALVVAVLINFSLLFARLVIDFSNFTAYQFYAQMSQNPQNFDIAEAYLRGMGITSIWEDSGNVIQNITGATQSGWKTLMFGFMGGLMLLAVALVLLYACLLMTWRALMFIFLMITGAAAFVTILWPRLSDSPVGLKNWWTTLINAAFFAPLLMIFLAISLAIVTTAGAGLKKVLGAVAASPGTLTAGALSNGTGPDAVWSSIILYAIGTGLLFVSIRLSSKIAGSIGGGMQYMPGIFRNMLSAPLRLASAGTGFGLQKTAGARAYRQAQELAGQARGANMNAGFQTAQYNKFLAEAERARQRGDTASANTAQAQADAAKRESLVHQASAAKLLKDAAAARKRADRPYSAADTAAATVLGRGLDKLIGTTRAPAEKGKEEKGYATKVEEEAKKAAALAGGANAGAAEQEAMRRQAEQLAQEQHANLAEQRRQAREDAIVRSREATETAAQQREATNKATEAIRNELSRVAESMNISQAQKDRIRSGKQGQDRVEQELVRDLRYATNDAERTRLRAALADVERLKDLNEQITAEERKAASTARDASSAKEAVRDAEAGIRRVQAEQARTASQILKDLQEGVRASTGDIAYQLGKKVNTDVADAARGMVKKNRSDQSQIAKLLKNINDEGGGAPPATPAH